MPKLAFFVQNCVVTLHWGIGIIYSEWHDANGIYITVLGAVYLQHLKAVQKFKIDESTL